MWRACDAAVERDDHLPAERVWFGEVHATMVRGFTG